MRALLDTKREGVDYEPALIDAACESETAPSIRFAKVKTVEWDGNRNHVHFTGEFGKALMYKRTGKFGKRHFYDPKCIHKTFCGTYYWHPQAHMFFDIGVDNPMSMVDCKKCISTDQYESIRFCKYWVVEHNYVRKPYLESIPFKSLTFGDHSLILRLPILKERFRGPMQSYSLDIFGEVNLRTWPRKRNLSKVRWGSTR